MLISLTPLYSSLLLPPSPYCFVQKLSVYFVVPSSHGYDIFQYYSLYQLLAQSVSSSRNYLSNSNTNYQKYYASQLITTIANT